MADDVAKKMMADLGLGRRDLVTAPDDERKLRDAQAIAARARERAAVQQTVKAHRARVAKATIAKGDDDRTARIKKWSDQTVFDKDEVTDQLENRFDGQGHRAGMKRRMGYDEKIEALENAKSEERRLYLQERGVTSLQDVRPASNQGRQNRRETPRANGGPSGQDRFFKHVLGGETTRQPRESRVASSLSTPNRGRERLVAGSNPNRAPSPRGRTRYQRDQVVRQTRVNQPAVQVAPPHVPASQTPPQQQNGMPPSTQSPQPVRPSQAVPIRAPSPSAQSNTTTSTRTRRSRGRGFRHFNDSNLFHGFNALNTTTPNTRPALANPMATEVYSCQALWYAANPGGDSDLYHELHPERKPLLEWALKKLVQEIVLFVKNGDKRDLEIYIETHKERKWMVDDAKKAKELVENSTEDEIEAYCEAHPTQKDFVKFAASHFTPLGRRDSILMVEEQSSTTDATASIPAPETREASVSNNTTNANVFTPAPKSVSAATEVKTTVQVSPPHRRVAMKASSQDVSSSPTYEAHVPRSPSHINAGMNGVSEQNSSSPLPAQNGDVNGVHASDSEDEAKDSSTTSVEVGVAPKEPDMLGRLTATFYDTNGMFVGIHQRQVQAPVMATMNFASRSPTYNPQELIAAIDSLAQSMMQKVDSVGAAQATNSNGSHGGHLVTYDESDDEEL